MHYLELVVLPVCLLENTFTSGENKMPGLSDVATEINNQYALHRGVVYFCLIWSPQSHFKQP